MNAPKFIPVVIADAASVLTTDERLRVRRLLEDARSRPMNVAAFGDLLARLEAATGARPPWARVGAGVFAAFSSEIERVATHRCESALTEGEMEIHDCLVTRDTTLDMYAVRFEPEPRS